MGLDLFRVGLGLDVESEDGSSNAYVIQGAGLPGGDTAEQDAAPIGSTYMRTDVETNNLQFYYKWSTANNSAADWKQATSKEYVDAIAAGLSWREPVLVHDNTTYATVAAAETAANIADTVDGVTIGVGDRVLFSDLTTGADNVYIVSGGTGAWTFTADANVETDGDAVLVQQGTFAGEQWVYDGAAWVQFGSAGDTAELGFLRAFVGKTGPGSESPTYTSTDVIAQSDNLEVAIGKLDASIGTQSYTNDNVVTDGEDVTTSIDALDTALGNQTYTNDNVVTDGESTTASIDAIDTAIGDLQDATLEITGANVVAVAGITLDTLPLTDATQVEWMVQVRETATPANRRGVIVHAFNDGSTLVDFSRSNILKLGSALAGFKVTADINGTDMRLRLDATNNVDYVVKRISYSSF